jgi:hypothetical protein
MRINIDKNIILSFKILVASLTVSLIINFINYHIVWPDISTPALLAYIVMLQIIMSFSGYFILPFLANITLLDSRWILVKSFKIKIIVVLIFNLVFALLLGLIVRFDITKIISIAYPTEDFRKVITSIFIYQILLLPGSLIALFLGLKFKSSMFLQKLTRGCSILIGVITLFLFIVMIFSYR